MRSTLARLVAATIVLALSACHDAGTKQSLAAHAVDQARICTDGGATLVATTNECACAEGATWNGSRCEAPDVRPATMGVAKPTTPPAHLTADEAEDSPAPAAVDGPVSVTPAPSNSQAKAVDAKALRADCLKAGAHFDQKDSYCHCAGGDVLIGTVCRAFAGQVNEMACTGVQHPGHWLKAHCDCEAGKEFIPGRGGCVKRRPLAQVTRRRICESSLNRGKWNARADRCDCGTGRVASGAVCELMGNIPSREVCESVANSGRWDKVRKRCDCPAGRLWIDQSCHSAAGIDAPLACASEANAGRWVPAEARCECPRRRGQASGWDAAGKICR